MQLAIETTDEKLFNISSGQPISLNDIIGLLKKNIKKDFEVNYSAARNIDLPVNYLENALAKEILGWSPKTKLKDGIIKTYACINYNY